MQAGLAEVALDALQPTAEYMALEEAEKARTVELWQRVANYEALHPISLKAWPSPLFSLQHQCSL